MDVTTLTTFTATTGNSASLLAAISISQIFLAAVAVVVLTIIMRSTGKRVQASIKSNDASARDRYQELAQKSNMTRDVGEVMLELDKLARQVTGQMDTRFVKLEIAIRDADKRIAMLTKLLQNNNSQNQPSRDQTVLDHSTQDQAALEHPSIDITLESENPYGSMEPTALPVSKPSAGDVRHQPIYSLFDSGLSSDAIAQKVGQTTGEVELILALRKTRQQAIASKNTLS